jgi:hypothetical protein
LPPGTGHDFLLKKTGLAVLGAVLAAQRVWGGVDGMAKGFLVILGDKVNR